jgi:hypothetical protein
MTCGDLQYIILEELHSDIIYGSGQAVKYIMVKSTHWVVQSEMVDVGLLWNLILATIRVPDPEVSILLNETISTDSVDVPIMGKGPQGIGKWDIDL